MTSITKLDFDRELGRIHTRAKAHHLNPKLSHLREALARAYGARTANALVPFFKEDQPYPGQPYDPLEFQASLAEFGELDGDAVCALEEGLEIEVKVSDYEKDVIDHPRYAGLTMKHVQVWVRNADASVLARRPAVIMPLFRAQPGDSERTPYQVDSSYNFRTELPGGIAVTRHRTGRNLLSVRPENGYWAGTFFIYAIEHRNDPTAAIARLKRALVQRFLPAFSSRVRCMAFRPDGYDLEVMRLHVSVGPEVINYWGRSPFVVAMPDLPKRRFGWESVPAESKMVSMASRSHFDALFDGGVWDVNVYSNGSPELQNETSMGAVRASVIRNIGALLKRAEFSFDAHSQ